MRRFRGLFCIACVVLGAGIACLTALQFIIADQATAADKPRAVNVNVLAPGADEDNDDWIRRSAPDPQHPAAPSNGAKQRYLDLVTKQAERMTEELLNAASEELSRTIEFQDQEAAGELNSIVQSLKAIPQKYPGTPAARKANDVLNLLEKPAQVQRRKQG